MDFYVMSMVARRMHPEWYGWRQAKRARKQALLQRRGKRHHD